MNPTGQTACSIIYHDPQGRMVGLIEQTLPLLASLFGGLAVQASAHASQRALELFERAGAIVQIDPPDDRSVAHKLGRIRAAAVRLGLGFGTAHIFQIDGDRLLHWAVHYPDELAAAAARISAADCTVFGRSPRAFASHPHAMRETEMPVNRLFSAIAGRPDEWDVMVGARGLSRRAAESILAGCQDEAISVDVSWPLHLWKEGFSLAYAACDGLEFETGDRSSDEIEALGGYERWLEQLDRDPQRWAARFRLAQLHCEAMGKYFPPVA